MNTHITKDKLVQFLTNLIAGTKKVLNGSTMTLGGQSYTATALVDTLQTLVDALAKSDAAKATWQGALQQAVQARTAVFPLLATYLNWLVATYGAAPDTLAEFGITPRKKRVLLSAKQNAAAAAKRTATRAARHTMGSRQKQAVKGDVTGVVVTPIVTPAQSPSPAPVSPAPAQANVTPAAVTAANGH